MILTNGKKNLRICFQYSNHIEQTHLQLSRDIKPLPIMKINPAVKSILDFKFEDFELVNYNPHPHIKGAVAI